MSDKLFALDGMEYIDPTYLVMLKVLGTENRTRIGTARRC
jgi:hypothetical protein